MNNSRTICAIATPAGVGGVAIIRVSGEDSFSIVQKIVSVDIEGIKTRVLTGCEIRECSMDCHANHRFAHNDEDNTFTVIDKGMVVKFVNPYSFTGEDVVELHIHGGVAVQKKVMNELFRAGAVAAAAGEFTHRAFINGKIDLTEAEAVGNIIHAQTEGALSVANSGMQGLLSAEIKRIRADLVHIVAGLFVDMDFGEEESEFSVPDLGESISALQKLISTADNGIIANRGLNVAIVGEPNVGKSSLLNALLGEDRAIVTDIAGTTRDTLTESANIGGHLVNFVDTAGIRETDDVIERMGVERARKAMGGADLVLYVIDSDSFPNTLRVSGQARDDGKHLIVRNKCDLVDGLDCHSSQSSPRNDEVIHISAKTGGGLDLLCERIAEYCGEVPCNTPIIVNERQKNQILLALGELESVSKGTPLDRVVTAVESAISALSATIGENVSDEIVGEIFRKFCVGK